MGKTITTHFIEGTPKGIHSVQMSNKTIMGFMIPRTEIKNMQQLDELSGAPSLYFLLGEELDGKEQAYIGQSTGRWFLTQDYTFTSPSTALSFCTGNSINGWQEWKNKAGKTLDEVYRK